MKIMKAIGLADGFCPNHYTTEEKLLWCHEVSAGLRRSSKKIYDVLELIHTEFADFELPDDIKFDDIESVFINGKMLDKVDFRSFGTLNNDELLKYGINCGGRLRIKIIYLTHPKPIRDTTIVGEFNTGENFIEMNLPPFEVQDAIEVVALSDLTAEPDW
ncbi:MAG: hypothetical protein RSA27_05895, partial [Oscillospiraceae bacterium]